ncbi:MAG: pilus assembly protein [Planctomycetes bacterium]|nr:pilus assembly protein [Planctomycetota bacterium]
MGRAVLSACLPWMLLLAALALCLVLLIRTSQARFRPARLWRLHRDEVGSVQTLSFVLTVPFFIMVILMILQVSQLMIGTIVVHYAAFAGARTAIVWIPARLGPSGPEWENCISWYYVDPEAPDQVLPILDPTDSDYGPTGGGVTYVIVPGSPKYRKIEAAALMACAPICPSRDLGLALSGDGLTAAEITKSLYRSMVPGYDDNARIPIRLENKLAYAARATEIEVRFFHTNEYPEVPLVPYPHLDDEECDLTIEYMYNELAWLDPITVKVKHQMALLPGPGRLLARTVRHPEGKPDEVAGTIGRIGDVYVYPLEATATLGNEGQKSMIPYEHDLY